VHLMCPQAAPACAQLEIHRTLCKYSSCSRGSWQHPDLATIRLYRRRLWPQVPGARLMDKRAFVSPISVAAMRLTEHAVVTRHEHNSGNVCPAGRLPVPAVVWSLLSCGRLGPVSNDKPYLSR